MTKHARVGAASPTSTNQQYRAIFEASSDGLVINDFETGIILEANPAFCRMHGYDDMTGFHPTLFIHPDSFPQLDQFMTTIRAGQEFNARACDIRRDGTVFDIEVHGRPLDYYGQPAILAVVRDISAEALAYRQLEERVAERTREIARRSQVAESLRELLAIVNSGQSLGEILETIVEQAGRLLGSDACAIYLPERVNGRDALAVRAHSGLSADYASVRIPADGSGTGLAYRRRRPVATPDVLGIIPWDPEITMPDLDDLGTYLRIRRLPMTSSIDDLPANEEVRQHGAYATGYRGLLAVPLAVKEESYGALTLFFRGVHQFTDEEIELATAFANQAALAIENARLYAREAQRRLETEALYEADEALHRSLRLNDVLQALTDAAASLFNTFGAGVWGPSPEEPAKTVLLAGSGMSEAYRSAVYTFDEWPIYADYPADTVIAAEDVETDPLLAERTVGLLVAEGVRSFLSAIVYVGDQVFGVFSVGFREPRAFSDEEHRLILALARRAGIAITNARLYEQAQQAATLEERQRIARELHDAVTQTLFSTSLIADVLPQIWENNPAEGRRQLGQLQRLTRGALAEMRTLLVELRPGALTEIPLGDLLRQIGEAAAGRSRTEITATVIGTPFGLPADVQIALYRIGQEALNNIVKHARADHASLDLFYDIGVTLRIADDGAGFDPETIAAGHLGLQIMRERAAAIGATLRAESAVGNGTRIEVHWHG